MTFTIDVSFNTFNSFFDVIELVKSRCKINKIQYEFNFEWISINDYLGLNIDGLTQIKIDFQNESRLLIQNLNNSLPRILLSEIDRFNLVEFVDYIEKQYSDSIVYGNISESIDKLLQNSERLRGWQLNDRRLPEYIKTMPNPIYTNEREKELVSLESLPGHSHQMNYGDKLWFGSCWQMYFSPIYYKYIPKFLFDNFHDCYEHKVFENGLRKITLYENPEDYDLSDSRGKQWNFRRALGIDSIAHELTKQRNRVEPQNLPVLITKQNCIKGALKVIQITENGLITREFLDDGQTLVYEEII